MALQLLQIGNFQFLVLVFGIVRACYVFTKIIPFVKKWRSIGIKSVNYIEDGLNGSSMYNKCKECTGLVLHDLKCTINKEKQTASLLK